MSDDGDDTRWEMLEKVSTPKTDHSTASGQSGTAGPLSNPLSDALEGLSDSASPSFEPSQDASVSQSNNLTEPEGQASSHEPSSSSEFSTRDSDATTSDNPGTSSIIPATCESVNSPLDAVSNVSPSVTDANPSTSCAAPLSDILSSDSTSTTVLPATDAVSTATTSASSKRKRQGPQQLGPLPESLSYISFTSDIVAERIRKDIYPIPFPIFCSLWPSPNIVLIGGGGGRPGTGIGSGVVICKLHKDEVGNDQDEKKHSHGDDNKCDYKMEPCAELDSQDHLVYQMCLHPSRREFVGAVGGRVYRFIITDDTLLSSSNYAQTDFHSETSEQFTSCVRFNMQGDVLATGGEDKFIRLWTYPGFEPMGTLGSHSSALSSLDFNRDGSKVISTAGSKQQPCMRVWATNKVASSGEEALIKEIRQNINGVEMEFRSCRWGIENCKLEGQEVPHTVSSASTVTKHRECILAIMNASPRGPGYLGKFDAENYSLLKLIKIDKNPLGNLETNFERDFVALANNEGTLWIYDVTTMVCVNKRTKCHDLPCTSLTWSPDSSMVCSASADKSVVFVPKVGSAGHNYIVLAMIVAVFLLFICLIGGLMR